MNFYIQDWLFWKIILIALIIVGKIAFDRWSRE